MKGSILALMMISGTAVAGTLFQLPPPPALVGVGIATRLACVGAGFTVDGSISGACHTATSSPCSGHSCQPVTYITNYIVTWDATGNPTGSTACSTVRHHLPQSDQTTYLGGHSAADCLGVVFNPTGMVVVINAAPYYYVTTDAVTGAELVNSSAAGFLYLP
jgi:hypothetical protein